MFAAILDIGVASLQRYERGCLASDSHAQLLANARDPRFLLKCLERGARKLLTKKRAKACDTVRKRGLSRVDYAVVRLNVLDEIAKEETLDTGMRASIGSHGARRWSTLPGMFAICIAPS